MTIGGVFILRDAANAAPQDEVLVPHGEERGNAARLEPEAALLAAWSLTRTDWR